MIVLYFIISILLAVIVYLIFLLNKTKKKTTISRVEFPTVIERTAKTHVFKFDKEISIRKFEDITRFGDITHYKQVLYEGMLEELLHSIPKELIEYKEIDFPKRFVKILEVSIRIVEPFKK